MDVENSTYFRELELDLELGDDGEESPMLGSDMDEILSTVTL